jgi:hypothetical protein
VAAATCPHMRVVLQMDQELASLLDGCGVLAGIEYGVLYRSSWYR